MQVHKGDQMEAHLGENLGDAMGLIDKPINHQVLLVLYFMFPENRSLSYCVLWDGKMVLIKRVKLKIPFS